jgi:hypothetical protein
VDGEAAGQGRLEVRALQNTGGVKVELSSDAIKASVAAYFRYARQCPLVAFEAAARLNGGYTEQADVLVVTGDRYLSVVEVKTSLVSDYREVKDGVDQGKDNS